MSNLEANSKVTTTLSNVKGTDTMIITSDAKVSVEKDTAVASDTDLTDLVDQAEDLVNELFESTETSEGDIATDTIQTDAAEGDTVTAELAVKEAAIQAGGVDAGVITDPGYMEGTNPDSGMMVDPTASGMKGSLLSSWPFVIGISSAVLVVSIILGVLLAKRKIKKGIELYED